MCGRYTLTASDPVALRERFPIDENVHWQPRYNIAPGDDVLAITTDRDGQPRGEMLRWGLVPSWAREPRTGLKLINARVESVAQRPAFRASLERFRCLILADGFYEWRAVAGRKQPFHITRVDGKPFSFAGLWSIWRAQDGTSIRSCAILTTSANSVVAELHDRMPVILEREAEDAWLATMSPRDMGPDGLLAGLPDSMTAMRAVGPAVNDARYDGPECLAPASARAQPTLF
ncbi:MAG: SOS response-associated peptidase [Solirubrobacterales bacterium]|nr:SOS response-associated peptidase [Solirubrobacterales bacterium]